MENCLYCYQPLTESEKDFHRACAKKFFGLESPPEIPYSENDFAGLAKEVIQHKTALTGVQAKISLHLSPATKSDPARRFTIVGLWGGYILKPPSEYYPQLPEVEDLTMHLAEVVKIRTAPHSLVRLHSGNLAYLTQRMDRLAEQKLAMEDMCQLTERLTEDKYRGSYEHIARTIELYSANPGLDVLLFYELLVFCFLTGNADMHLKNFSLLETPGFGMTFSPAYDLLNTHLVNPADKEEVALTLNGRKRKLRKEDFTKAMSLAGIEPRQQENLFQKMRAAVPEWEKWIERSFLSDAFKASYKELLMSRLERLV